MIDNDPLHWPTGQSQPRIGDDAPLQGHLYAAGDPHEQVILVINALTANRYRSDSRIDDGNAAHRLAAGDPHEQVIRVDNTHSTATGPLQSHRCLQQATLPQQGNLVDNMIDGRQ
jgi:hypothetical protein